MPDKPLEFEFWAAVRTLQNMQESVVPKLFIDLDKCRAWVRHTEADKHANPVTRIAYFRAVEMRDDEDWKQICQAQTYRALLAHELKKTEAEDWHDDSFQSGVLNGLKDALDLHDMIYGRTGNDND